jgi:putative transcriptional regulator
MMNFIRYRYSERNPMIRMNLAKLHADLCFAQGRKIEWREVAEQSEIHRVTLSKMVNQRGYNATVSNIDRLCRYFDCKIEDLLTYIPDEDLEVKSEMSHKGAVAKTPEAGAGAAARHSGKAKPTAKPKTKTPMPAKGQ